MSLNDTMVAEFLKKKEESRLRSIEYYKEIVLERLASHGKGTLLIKPDCSEAVHEFCEESGFDTIVDNKGEGGVVVLHIKLKGL